MLPWGGDLKWGQSHNPGPDLTPGVGQGQAAGPSLSQREAWGLEQQKDVL